MVLFCFQKCISFLKYREQIMQDCWMDPYTNRPSFTDIVKILENVVESDGVSHIRPWSTF